MLTFYTILTLTAASLPAIAQERVLRVARVSLVEGDVNFQRSQDKRDEWFEATANLPLHESDQIYTGANGRAEVQFTGGNLVRLSGDTNFRISQFNNATMQFGVSIGTATFRIDNLDKRKLQTVDASQADNDQPIYFEVDSPVVAVTFLREGSYRINVADDGTTEVIVRRGAVELYNKELGTIPLKEGRRIVVEGKDPSLYQVRKVEEKDEWDRWNDRRDQELFARAEYRSVHYVPAYIPGVYDLDHYGDWIDAPGYGWVWCPRVVSYGWAPYRNGNWRWYPTYGWTWVGYEPWGWVPYHYGRWAYWSNRWCWVPQISFGFSIGWSWSPALVAFYGSPGYGRGYRDGFNDGYRRGRYDWVGWVPLAPGEHPRAVNTSGREPVTIERASMLRNYTAPGGVSGVEGRNFERPNVIVRDVVAEPKGTGSGRAVEVLPVKADDVKPTTAEIPRAVQFARSPTGRDLNSTMVVRRPSRSESEVTGGGQTARPERGGGGEGRPASTFESGLRPSRTPDFTPAERPVAPRPGESRPQRAEGGNSSRESQGDSSRPRRDDTPVTVPRGGSERLADQPSLERPSRPQTEPRRVERQESTPRQSSPSPRPERQAQPAPERSQPTPERSQPTERSPQPAPRQPSSDRPAQSAPSRESTPAREVSPKKPSGQ
jgi:hypothetical protein